MAIHRLLQTVVLPAEHIISVASVAGRVARGPHERLPAVGEVRRVAVERARVPHSLEQDLREPHGVRRRAGAAGLEGARLRVRDVVLVVGRVEVLAVPARREPVVRHDAAGARLRREADGLRRARALVLHADVGQLPELPRFLAVVVGRVADEHPEPGLEGCDGGLLRGVEESV